MFRSLISEEESKQVYLVRDLVEKNIKEKASEYDAKGDQGFDWSALEIFAEHNLLAPSIPKKYGGLGYSNLVTAMILEEIAYGCAGVATVIAANLHAINPLLTVGTEEQREEFLPLLTGKKAQLSGLAMSEKISNLGITSHHDSFDIKGTSILAEENEEYLILNGYKNHVMNGSVASFLTLLVTLSPRGEKPDLQVLIMPLPREGLKVISNKSKLGLKYCDFSEIFLDQVKIEKKYMVGKKGSGFLVLMQNMDRMVPYIAAIAVGVSRAAYEHALDSARSRFVMGKPSFEESAVSFSLVDMATRINAGRLSMHLACWLIDNDLEYSQASSKAKILVSDLVQEITHKSMEVIGGGAFRKGQISEKLLRDAKMLSLLDGSGHFHRSLLASQII